MKRRPKSTGNPRSVIKIDCAEFQHSHEIAKLIGAPPGYLGHRETLPLLSQEVLNQHHTDGLKLSFVLFDEIEKASDALWNLLLGILDKATLTLGNNRMVDFSRAMIFMTSNLGACEMSSIMSPRHGFGAFESRQNVTKGVLDENMTTKISRTGVEAARKKFTPEFMNRLDKIVTFQPLGVEQLKKILHIELGLVQQRIFNTSTERAFVFTLAEASKTFFARGRHGPKIRRPAPQACDRTVTGPSSIEPDRHRSSARRRLDSSGLRPRRARPAIFKGSRGSPHVGHGASGGYLPPHSRPPLEWREC